MAANESNTKNATLNLCFASSVILNMVLPLVELWVSETAYKYAFS